MTKFTLQNSFHNTSRTILIDPKSHKIPRATARHIKRSLCPVDGCTCGDVLGRRGGDDLTGKFEVADLFEYVQISAV